MLMRANVVALLCARLRSRSGDLPALDTDLTARHLDTVDDLVRSAQLGSHQAFEEIVRLHQADVRMLTRRFMGPGAAADDVAQDVFVQIYRSIGSYSGEGSLRAWILGIARNRIATYFRKEAKHLRNEALGIEAELQQWRLAKMDTAPSDSIEATAAELQALKRCQERLADRHRQLLERFYFRGDSAEAIAADEGKKAGAVRMALLRIRTALGKCIRQQTQE